jgi:hypothetical protein
MTRPRRILFVAIHTSPHTARWIEALAHLGWDLHMFPVFPGDVNPKLEGVTVHWPVTPATPAPAITQSAQKSKQPKRRNEFTGRPTLPVRYSLFEPTPL